MTTLHAAVFGAMIAGLAAAACSTAPQPSAETATLAAAETPDPRLGERVDKICFTRNIDSFQETTRNSVIVRVGVNDFYLVETFGPCFDLNFAQSIGFESRTGSCLRRTDRLSVSDSAFGLHRSGGLGPQRCQIRAIYEWDPEAAAGDAADGETETDTPTSGAGTDI